MPLDMKKILITCLLLCAAFAARAQNPDFSSLYENCSGREGFTCIEMGGKMMKMLSRSTAADDRELAALLDGIRSIRIVAAKPPREEFLSQLLCVAKSYNLILSQSEGEQTTCFYFIDGGRGYSEFLMLVSGTKEQVAVAIYGVFDVKDISRLSSIRPM